MITDEMVEAAAESDARFDGHEGLICLTNLHRTRYRERARAALLAAEAARPLQWPPRFEPFDTLDIYCYFKDGGTLYSHPGGDWYRRSDVDAALLAAEAARKPDAAWRADHEYQWTTGRDEWQRRENERLAAWRPSGPDVVPGLERAREIVQSMFCDSEDGEAARDEAVADISAEIAKHRPSPSPEHPVDDDALVRRLDGLPQP
jgi:hypothetical protein